MSSPSTSLPNIAFNITRNQLSEPAEFICRHNEPLDVLLRGEVFMVAENAGGSDFKLSLIGQSSEQIKILNDLRQKAGVTGEDDRSRFDFDPETVLAYNLAVNQTVIGTPVP